jgi:hypothetical protein
LGEEQPAQAPASTRHSKLEPGSEEENEKLAERDAVVPEGPAVIDVAGAVRSGGGGGGGGRSGSKPRKYSSPSLQPSPSVSRRRGDVRVFRTSVPSPRPSSSVSTRRGEVPAPLTSRPSERPSRSVSARRGLVRERRTS